MTHPDHLTAGPWIPRRKVLLTGVLHLALMSCLLPRVAHAAEADAPAAPAASDLAPWNERLQTLIGQLKPYEIPHLDEIAAGPSAGSLDELTARIDRLYAVTAFQSARWIWTYETNLRALTDERVRLEEGRVTQAKLELALAAAPSELARAELRTSGLIEQAAREERTASVLRDNAAVVAEDFLAARTSTLGSVYYLLPTNLRVSFHEGTQKNAGNPIYARLPEVEATPRAAPAPALTTSSPAAKEATAPTQPPPPVPGTIAEKFAAFEDKQRALRNLAALLPPQEAQLATARALADEQQKRNEALTTQLAAYEGPLAKLAAAGADAEDRILTAQVNQKISAGNLLRAGTAAILWSYIKETIVAPQMEHFLADNGIGKVPQGPALIDAIATRPQDFIPKKGAFENAQPLSALRLKLLDVEPSLDVRAPAAAEALETGRIGGSAELIGRFFKDLDAPALAVLRATTDTLDPHQKKIAAVILARAPAR